MKKRNWILALTIIFTLNAFLSSLAQQGNIDSLIKKFNLHRQQNFQEKIYVHTDRSTYLAGETIWFKIYLTDASTHKPSPVSKVAYIEVIDRKSEAVLKTKIEIADGMGTGSIYVPVRLNTDKYIMRAYTSWMKNYSPEFYYHQSISIINSLKNSDDEPLQNLPTYDAQFFPEGGNLIAGIKSKVAFRVTDTHAKGIPFDGAILNEQNDTIVKFKPYRFGIGHFYFTPQQNQKYHGSIRDINGKITIARLPSILATGYSMEVIDNPNGQIKVTIKTVLPDSVDNGVYLFIHSRNSIVHSSYRYLKNGSTTFVVNANLLKEGISHFTIFDEYKNPVCERLYFKQPQENLALKVIPDQVSYNLRKPVKIDLTATTNESTSPSDLSISVFKQDSLTYRSGNMLSYFWLSSDLKGQIESPEYYFQPSPDSKEAIDNLMLTHGWRRFDWSKVLTDKVTSINFIPELRGHLIQGSVMDNGNMARGIKTYLTTLGSANRLYPSISDNKGNVFFEIQNLNGYSKINVQTNNSIDSLCSISILSPFSKEYAKLSFPQSQLSTSIKDLLMERSIAMQVQDIYFSKNERASISIADSSTFYGKSDERYLLDAYTRFPTMEDVMREYVRGIFVRKRKDGFHFLTYDNLRKSAFEESPLMLLDGVPVFSENEIMAINPIEIKKLEVITRKYYLGPMSFAGVLSLSTYKGDLGGIQLNPKSVTLNYEGLQLKREFYSPKYENEDQKKSRLPDQRYLLYWNPKVITGKDGHQQLEFYTSDIPGEYKIVVEGITKDGHVGSSSASFKVAAENN
jgi:hypothetical protein